uniref:Family with sequence similarity 124B n=1 Tax=Hippocampus comes TaxID=109280 RepID=A0A3Q2Y2K9_HIPCM
LQHQQRLLVLNLHLLANPGDSLLLQHSLDRLIRWICPSLHVFHVSERASPHGGYARLCSPSLAITFFLHEAYGEERILKVLDFFQRPPWQYHHTESCSSKSAGRDFYSLGAGMPVWGVRPVHCGGEILRVTLYSAYDNYEDAVRFYETVLQQQAEEQKTGFCWFTLHTEPGLCLQLAIKQVSAGVCVEPCNSAVLQFSVDEIGQLVPLLPNPCTPISTSRWQTEDLDGNKVLFQVGHPRVTSASQLGYQRHTQNVSPSNLQAPPSWQNRSAGLRVAGESAPEKPPGSQGSGSLCSTPPSSSCYSSQRSSPAPPPSSDSPLRPPLTRSLSRLLPEENEQEGETNVDTGIPVPAGITRSSSVELLSLCQPRNPSAKARSPSRKWRPSDCADDVSNFRARRTTDSSYNETSGAAVELFVKMPSSLANAEEQADEFFI